MKQHDRPDLDYLESDGIIPLPPVVRIEPASACNLRCTHCPTGVFSMQRTIMKPDVFERCLAELAKHVPPVRVVSLYQGGEPFLNKRFLEMPAQVKAIGVPLVKTISNGMLIKPERIDEIVTCGLDQIEISLDGASAEQSDFVRVRARFDYIADIVRKLVEARNRLNPSFRVTISNTQFPDLQNFDLSVDFPDPAAYLLETFSDIADQLEFNANWARLWPSKLPADGFDLLHDDRPRESPTRCFLLEDMLNIRADGQVVACCYDLTSISNLGNVMTTSIEDIWNGEAARSFRRNFAAKNYPGLCQNCIVVTGDKFLVPKKNNEPQREMSATALLSDRSTPQRA